MTNGPSWSQNAAAIVVRMSRILMAMAAVCANLLAWLPHQLSD